MARKGYVPHKGDICWVELQPTKGHEQSGMRPVLIASPKEFNAATGLAWIIPITSKKRGHAIEVAVKTAHVAGVLLVSQIRTIDWHTRRLTFIEKAPAETVREVLGIIVSILTSS